MTEHRHAHQPADQHQPQHRHAEQPAGHGGHREHAFDSPRRYDLKAEVLFLGGRRGAFDRLADVAGVHAGQRVLDVGSGTGFFVRLLAERVGPSGLALGLDPAPAMVRYATEQARSGRTAGRGYFSLGSATTLALPDHSFDVVVSSLVLHHLSSADQATALGEIARVLRPGGTVLIAEAQRPPGPGWKLLARVAGYGVRAEWVPSLEPLLGRAGFSGLRVGQVPPWLQYVAAAKPA